MPYRSYVYQKALNILERRRSDAQADLQQRTDEAMKKIPQLAEIQTELARTGLAVSTLLFRSKDAVQEIEELKKKSLALQKRKKELLVKAGFDEDALSLKYICPVCSDTGFVNNRMCTCHMELLKEIERDSIRKNAPIDDCTFDNFNIAYYPQSAENGVSPREKAAKILESCRVYAQKFTPQSPNLMFMGGTGLGKTHLSLAIANVVISRGYSVIYGTSQNIFSDLQDEKFGRADNINYNEHDILNTDLLILDDLGTEFKNQFTEACLYNIINTRALKKKATVISTNFSFDDLERDYNQRVTSRLAGEYSVLVLEGNDIRYIK